MIVFNTQSKYLYRLLRSFEFHTGETAMACFYDVNVKEFINWVNHIFTTTIEGNYNDVEEVVDSTLSKDIVTRFEDIGFVRQYLPLALFCIFIEESGMEDKFIITSFPLPMEIKQVIDQEVKQLEIIFGKLDNYLVNINSFI